MSATQDWPLRCECQKSAPFRFIALLDPNNGGPNLGEPGEIYRGATCKEFNCKFWYAWDGVPMNEGIAHQRDQYRFPESSTAQQIGTRTNYDNIGLRGRDNNHVGDSINNVDFKVLYDYSIPVYFNVTNTIKMDFNLLHSNSIPVDILLHPNFEIFLENSTEIEEQRRRHLMSIIHWIRNFG